MQTVAESIAVEDFYSPMHRNVFRGMLDLHASGKPIEAIAIHEAIKKQSVNAPSPLDIMNLSHGIPHFTAIDTYLGIVREKANLRELIRECHAVADQALQPNADTDSVFANAQNRINDICLRNESGNSKEYFVPLRKIVQNEILAKLDAMQSGTSSKIKLGFPAIDNAIGGGLAPSDVMLIAANTGRGKSAFALQAAYQIAVHGMPTAFLAGEMTNAENVLRLLSQVSGFTNLNWVQHLSSENHKFLTEWAVAIQDAPINFEHRISDLRTLATHMRSLVRREKTKVLVIDYIQLFKLDKVDTRQRHERIAEASQETKRLANELDLAIIEVAQFNREGAKAPQAGLHDLEGSGQLEKDASIACIIETADLGLRDKYGAYFEAKLRIVKGRNTGLAEIAGKFYGSNVRFEFN